jgi:hypothetical protein
MKLSIALRTLYPGWISTGSEEIESSSSASIFVIVAPVKIVPRQNERVNVQARVGFPETTCSTIFADGRLRLKKISLTQLLEGCSFELTR